MDVTRLFEKNPPREPLVTLDALLRDWDWRTAPGGGLDKHRDAVVDYCREARNFHAAVWRAAYSQRPDGRLHSHQKMVDKKARERFAEHIIGVWTFDWMKFREYGFDHWYDALADLRPEGIGPVTTYDMAVRIGAFMGVRPESYLYLHAGVREGWRALRACNGYRHKVRVHRSHWPDLLRDRDADDVEDFLCTYRGLFSELKRDG